MMWPLILHELLLFIAVIFCENRANLYWNTKQRGSFVFWVSLMVIGILRMMFIV